MELLPLNADFMGSSLKTWMTVVVFYALLMAMREAGKSLPYRSV